MGIKTLEEIKHEINSYSEREKRSFDNGFQAGYSTGLKDVIDQFKSKWIDGYRETLKADLIYSVDLQEQGVNEDLNRGREEGIKYALDMLDMHLPAAPERKGGL